MHIRNLQRLELNPNASFSVRLFLSLHHVSSKLTVFNDVLFFDGVEMAPGSLFSLWEFRVSGTS